jgi:hypothetical protein
MIIRYAKKTWLCLRTGYTGTVYPSNGYLNGEHHDQVLDVWAPSFQTTVG